MRQSFRISTRPHTTEWVASGSQLLHIERSHLLLPELCPSSRRKEKAPSDSGKTHYMRIPFPLPAVPRGIFGGKPGAQTGDRLGLQADLCPPWDTGSPLGAMCPSMSEYDWLVQPGGCYWYPVGMSWVKARDAAKDPTTHRMGPPREDLAPNVNGAEADRAAWEGGLCHITFSSVCCLLQM